MSDHVGPDFVHEEFTYELLTYLGCISESIIFDSQCGFIQGEGVT